MHIASSTPTAVKPTLPVAVTEPRRVPNEVEVHAHVAAPALDRFDRPAVTTTPSTGSGTPVVSASAATSRPANQTIDLGFGSERGSYSKTSEIYSGSITAGVINQRGPMPNSRTSSRETAVASLEFVDKRGFFGGASSVDVELVPQHTIIDRSTMGGQLVEQRRTGVLSESQATLVRLERDTDGVYRANAGNNQAFFVTSSETGYARRILEDIKISVRAVGVEDTAYGARYGML
jgi:hypothetical protein